MFIEIMLDSLIILFLCSINSSIFIYNFHNNSYYNKNNNILLHIKYNKYFNKKIYNNCKEKSNNFLYLKKIWMNIPNKLVKSLFYYQHIIPHLLYNKESDYYQIRLLLKDYIIHEEIYPYGYRVLFYHTNLHTKKIRTHVLCFYNDILFNKKIIIRNRSILKVHKSLITKKIPKDW